MSEITVYPAHETREPGLEEVFGFSGGTVGCWYTCWRVPGREYSRIQGEPDRRQLRELVAAESPPGLLAYHEGQAAGWCTVAPRSTYTRLLRWATLTPAEPDDPGMWAVPCFYVSPEHRSLSLLTDSLTDDVIEDLLETALSIASDQGGREIEGYPMDPDSQEYSAAELYTGTVDLFARHGFREISRPSPGRVVMRRDLP